MVTIPHAKTCSHILSSVTDQSDRFSDKIDAAGIERIKSTGNILRQSIHAIKPKTSCMFL